MSLKSLNQNREMLVSMRPLPGTGSAMTTSKAEIRSVAVHPLCQAQGFGKRLVAALVDRCRDLGLPRVFAFTLAAPFFSKCGFSEFKRDDMPAIVWVECSKCPKFYCCDEIGMILEL